MSYRLGLVLISWVITRTWMWLSGFENLPYPVGVNLFSDINLYNWWAGNIFHGHFPINDPAWQYPPLAAFVFLLGYIIAPKGVGFVVLVLIADACILYYLIESAGKSEKRNYLPAAIWVSTAIFMGPIMLGRFDVFPTLFAVLALLFISSPKWSGINIGIGIILKVWPALLIAALPRKQFKTTLLWIVGTFYLLAIGLTLWWPNSFAFISGQKSRGLQIESVGALPLMYWNAFFEKLEIGLRYGSIEVVHPSVKYISLIVTLVGLILIANLIRLRYLGAIENIAPSTIALYLVAVSMLTSRVFSPQYMVWLFGLLAVCSINPSKNFKKIFIMIAISAFMGQLIYPTFYFGDGGLIGGAILPLAIQTIRIATLVTATYLMWLDIKPSGSTPANNFSSLK